MDWEELMSKHGDTLLLYARQWSESLTQAEDAVQLGFVKFWQRWKEKPSHITEPASYLFATVKRTAIDLQRSQFRRKNRELKVGEELIASSPWFQYSFEQEEQNQELAEKIQVLPLEQREVIIMKIWGELTFLEISESLDVSANTVASRYRYGLQTLKKLMTV